MLLVKVSTSASPSASPNEIEVAFRMAGSYSTSRSKAETISPGCGADSPETTISMLIVSPTNALDAAGCISIVTASADCDANTPARSAAATNLLISGSPSSRGAAACAQNKSKRRARDDVLRQFKQIPATAARGEDTVVDDVDSLIWV